MSAQPAVNKIIFRHSDELHRLGGYPLAVRRLGTCEQVPVTVDRIEWVNHSRRTGIPPGPLHDQWHFEIDLVCEDRQVRAAAMVLTDGLLRHTRGWADRPSTTVAYRVTLFPFYHEPSDKFQINIHGIRLNVTSETLKTQPQTGVQPLVQTGDSLTTGTVIDLLNFTETGWTAQIALFVTQDTKNDRTRWHVRQPLRLQPPYEFLMTGRRSGWVRPANA